LYNDHTYEYLAYRDLEKTNEERGVDVESVIAMDIHLGDYVFSNLDEKKRILIEPRGPDPVLYGIRGETAAAVVEAASLVRSTQSVERWLVFRTNQATSEHLIHKVRVGDLRPYMAVMVQGYVGTKPTIFEGGFVVFGIKDETGSIDCAAYEPTRQFRDIVSQLQIGDEVRVHASVRPKSRTHGRTLNLEGLEILHLSPEIKSENPLCPECSKRMKSAGSGKGFKCPKCGYRNREGTKLEESIERKIGTGLYLPPLSAHRHLTRPLSRLRLNNSDQSFDLVGKWSSH
jgi:tRNA(Ile2)-agmatinylcytidine synthase